jgi:hypothetical protein
MRAQELMKLTELPDGVELHSDVDEDASHCRESYVQEFNQSHFLPPKQYEISSSLQSIEEDDH